MATIQIVEPRGQARHDVNQRRHEPRQPQVISGETFRRDILGWSKRPFYALVKSGRIQHLRAINLCTARRTFYVKAQAELWATEQPDLRLGKRPSLQSRAR